jgi:hypothetical protein
MKYYKGRDGLMKAYEDLKNQKAKKEEQERTLTYRKINEMDY